jgi:2,3-bisphosphoglycerate-independent phosphoglycerate mutase
MAADEVADKLIAQIERSAYDLIVANFANPDMVGHTGDLEATIRAVEVVDSDLGRVLDAVQKAGGASLIIADHGNADQMSGDFQTAHNLNRVPAVLFDPRKFVRDAVLRPGGVLADVAPTVLDILKIIQPLEMTGRSLLARSQTPTNTI